MVSPEAMENFSQLFKPIKALEEDIPDIAGVDVWGVTIPYGPDVGGDHIIYVDFAKRLYDLDARIAETNNATKQANLEQCKTRGGVLISDALAEADMDTYGEITTRAFERLNNRFWKSSEVKKYVTLLYGEVAVDGTFRYINAGHPSPFLYNGKLTTFSGTSSLPLGVAPSKTIDAKKMVSPLGYKEPYVVNETMLHSGNILLLHTDGLKEHNDHAYCASRLESVVAEHATLSAREITAAILHDAHHAAPFEDDITVVTIKKT